MRTYRFSEASVRLLLDALETEAFLARDEPGEAYDALEALRAGIEADSDEVL